MLHAAAVIRTRQAARDRRGPQPCPRHTHPLPSRPRWWRRPSFGRRHRTHDRTPGAAMSSGGDPIGHPWAGAS